jgi:hypothetical protein
MYLASLYCHTPAEDKRQRKKKAKANDDTIAHGLNDTADVSSEANKKAKFEDLVEGTQTIPSWAMLPDPSKFKDNIIAASKQNVHNK